MESSTVCLVSVSDVIVRCIHARRDTGSVVCQDQAIFGTVYTALPL